MFLRLTSALASVVLFGAAPTYAQEQPAELWNGLNIGMTPVEVSAVLMAKPGVERTRLGRPDRDGVVVMHITKQRESLLVAEQRTLVWPEFVAGALQNVEIRLMPAAADSYCSPEASSFVETLAQLLALKYSPVAGSRPQAYTNGISRVTLSASTTPASTQNLNFVSALCETRYGDGSTVQLFLEYEPEALAQARDNSQNQANQDRLRRSLNGL